MLSSTTPRWVTQTFIHHPKYLLSAIYVSLGFQALGLEQKSPRLHETYVPVRGDTQPTNN